MYRADKTKELARRIADYIEDRSYGKISAKVIVLGGCSDVIASLDSTEMLIRVAVYDEQDALHLWCETEAVLEGESDSAEDYIGQLDGYTLVGDASYEWEEEREGDLVIRLVLDDYASHGAEEAASLACANLIPVLEIYATRRE